MRARERDKRGRAISLYARERGFLIRVFYYLGVEIDRMLGEGEFCARFKCFFVWEEVVNCFAGVLLTVNGLIDRQMFDAESMRRRERGGWSGGSVWYQ